MKFALLFATLAIPSILLTAQENKSLEDKEAAYTKTITTRAEKIVATLGIVDSLKAKHVTGIITNHYRNLNVIYTQRDEQVKLLKGKNESKNVTDSLTKTIEEATSKRTESLHQSYLKALSKELNKEQVVKVKDGMTYSVLPLTYKAFLDMIPSLKQTEKDQIMAWLVEAREHAMDAESSDKKHWWFGKYKGKINNYLAAQGYDLQQERKGWEGRQKAEKEKREASKH